MKSSEASLSSSAHEQVLQCKICKIKLDNKNLAVLHVQSVHAMKGSGDVLHDYEVLLGTGNLAPATSTSSVPVPLVLSQDTAVGGNVSLGVDEEQALELTGEEWELVNAVDKYQESDYVETFEVVSLLSDEASDDSDDECVVIEETGSRSVHSLMEGYSGKSKSEREAEIDPHKSRILNICESKEALESD